MRKYILLLTFLFGLMSVVTAQKSKVGGASFYADKFQGRKTASGEKYYHNKMTAAHRTLPFGTMVKVTNLTNGKSVIVRVNDRGPFVKGRIIDLSKSAAKKLDFINAGVAKVRIEILSKDQKKEETTKNDTHNKGGGNTTKKTTSKKEIYRFSAIKTYPRGYSVQIGSFKEMVNLMKLSENLGTSYKNEVFVEVGQHKAEKVYKICVGRLRNRKEAEQLKLRIKKKYPDCFIVKF